MPVAEVIAAVRVAATPEALDAAGWPADATVLRTAPDEVLVVDALDVTAPEPHAIVFPDTSWVRVRLTPSEGVALLAAEATWPPPTAGLGQGMVAGVPAKVVVGPDEWWVIVPGAVAAEFGARVDAALGVHR